MNVIATMNVSDDYSTQSLIVMPGCTLEVWDKDSNPESKRERSRIIFCSL